MSEPLATERQRVLFESREIWRQGFVTFDTETTGLAEWDEIVQWAVCSQDGQVLGQGYIKPTVEISPGAQDVHGINIEQLADAPTFDQAWTAIRNLLSGKTVVIYNSSYDIRLLWQSAEPYKIDLHEPLISTIKTHCAMELFARFYGEVHEYYGTYVWQKLDLVAIPHLQIEVPGQPHHADYDAAATAMVIKRLAEMADEELPQGWHLPVWVKCAGGCGAVKECAEESDIWYCQQCGVQTGVFHKCPGCRNIIETADPLELCEYCDSALEQEKMLLTGLWHFCPNSKQQNNHLVKTPDVEELCEGCQRQARWKREAEERERERQARIERERKEAKKASQARYRQKKREEKAENERRAAQGLPPLEPPKRPEPEREFMDNGHHFTRGKDSQGLPIVTCSLCLQTWRRPPVAHCLKLPTFTSWESKPADWHTKTALGRLKMQAIDWRKPSGFVITMKATYPIYDQALCTPIEKKHAVSQ